MSVDSPGLVLEPDQNINTGRAQLQVPIDGLSGAAVAATAGNPTQPKPKSKKHKGEVTDELLCPSPSPIPS